MSPFQNFEGEENNQIVKCPFEKDYGLNIGRSSPFREGQKDMESFYPFVLFQKDYPHPSSIIHKFLEQRVY